MLQSECMEKRDSDLGQKSLRIYIVIACGVTLEDFWFLYCIFLVGQPSCDWFMWFCNKNNQSALNLQTIMESE